MILLPRVRQFRFAVQTGAPVPYIYNMRPPYRRLWSCLAIVAASWLTAPRAALSQTAEQGAFLLRVRGDTVIVERFRRTATSVQGSVSTKGAPRIEYNATLSPSGAISALTLLVFAANATADAAPQRTIALRVTPDTVFADVGGSKQKLATKPDAILGLNNAFALFELFTRRYRATGTGTLWYTSTTAPVTLPVEITPLGPDSVLVKLAGQEERLQLDSIGRILGGTVVAQQLDIIRVSGEAAQRVSIGKPDYSAPANAPYTAEEVTVRVSDSLVLGGTLTLPRGGTSRMPAIVTITGSGQQDRDEYISIVPGGYRLFRQVADTLSRRGIAVLRLDDRTVGASGGAIGTSADYADDVRAALRYLRTRPEIDPLRLGLVGHSEGGLIAPMVAATDPTLKGIVLMAGPSLTGRTILNFQVRNLVSQDTSIAPAKRDSAITATLAGIEKSVATDTWMKFFLDYDPLPTARKVRTPTLILQGATDQQVTPNQAEQLAAEMKRSGNRRVTVRTFPAHNHLFLADSSGSPAGYMRLPDHRVPRTVLGALAEWLVVTLAAKPSM